LDLKKTESGGEKIAPACRGPNTHKLGLREKKYVKEKKMTFGEGKKVTSKKCKKTEYPNLYEKAWESWRNGGGSDASRDRGEEIKIRRIRGRIERRQR